MNFIALFVLVAARRTFVAYESSPWETEWLSNITKWHNAECEVMAQPYHHSRARALVRLSQVRARARRRCRGNACRLPPPRSP
jgi:hypothetical protein